jgi:hypothetical protein
VPDATLYTKRTEIVRAVPELIVEPSDKLEESDTALGAPVVVMSEAMIRKSAQDAKRKGIWEAVLQDELGRSDRPFKCFEGLGKQ